MVKDLSQNIIVGLPMLEEECPNCKFIGPDDSSSSVYSGLTGTVIVFSGTSCERTVTGISFRRRCPVCQGKGVLQCENEKTIYAMVNWDPTRFDVGSDAIPVTPAGLGSQKIVRIKTDIVYWEDIKDAEYYEINGMRLEPFQEPYKRGMGKREAVVVAFLSTTEASEEEND